MGIEHDPGYNPERGRKSIEMGHENEHSQELDLRLERDVVRDNEKPLFDESVIRDETQNTMLLSRISVPLYHFSSSSNPFAWDESERVDLEPIAQALDTEILRRFEGRNILVRGIQSHNHEDTSPSKLLEQIIRYGTDRYLDIASDLSSTQIDLYAVEYRSFSAKDSTIGIFEGFHKWKPKSEERPHYPIDIVMIFDASSYERVEYLHPRHGVVASDAWRLRTGVVRHESLLGIVAIN